MTVGDGIALAAVVCSIVALFIATKDRWNWKKIILWPLGIILGITVFGGVALWAWSAYHARPQVQQEIWGVALGDTVNDVMFKKGKPVEINQISEGNFEYDYRPNEKTSVNIRITNGKVRAVYALASERDYLVTLQGIDLRDTSEDVISKFGRPTEVRQSPNGTARVYAYPQYNVFFALSTNRVEVIGIYDPSQPLPLRPADEFK